MRSGVESKVVPHGSMQGEVMRQYPGQHEYVKNLVFLSTLSSSREINTIITGFSIFSKTL